MLCAVICPAYCICWLHFKLTCFQKSFHAACCIMLIYFCLHHVKGLISYIAYRYHDAVLHNHLMSPFPFILKLMFDKNI